MNNHPKLKAFIIIGIVSLLGCTSPDKTTFIEDLETAYKLEVNSGAKYEAFAMQTRKDGFERLSVIFLAASKSAGIRAEKYRIEIKKLGVAIDVKPVIVIKSTKENFSSTIEEIKLRLSNVYPKLLKRAPNNEIKKLYTWARKTEEKQNQYFNAALQAVETNTTNSFYTFFLVCPECGYVIMPQELSNECNLCKHPKEKLLPVG